MSVYVSVEDAKQQACIGPLNCGKRVSISYKAVPNGGNIDLVELPAVGNERRHCIGPECKMAWRWITEIYDTTTGGVAKPGHAYQEGRLSERQSATHGYCGLAGKP